MTKIDDIKENANLIPFLGAYFILYGSIDLMTFYREFNISIIHFINFSEIVFYFIRDLYIVIAHVILLLLGIVGFSYFKTKVIGSLDTRISEWNESQIKVKDILDTIDKDNINLEDRKRLEEADKITKNIADGIREGKRRTKRVKTVLLIAGLLVVSQLVWLIYEFGWMNGLRFVIPIISSFGIGYFIKDFRLFMVVYSLVSLLTSAYFNAKSNADKVRNGANYGMNVDMDGRLIISDSSNFVIGKTENYLFYYESKLKRTTVYPIDKMDYITVPDK